MRIYLVLFCICCFILCGYCNESKLQLTKTIEGIKFKISRMQHAIENEDTVELEKLKSKINSKQPFESLVLKKGIDGAYKEVWTNNTYPLIWAIYCHKKKSVKKLLELGANVNTGIRLSPLQYLTWGYSCNNDGGFTKINRIDIEILKLLLEQKNIDINAICDTSDSPLSLALKKKNYEAVELLLKKGADPDIFITEVGCEDEEGYIPESLLYLSIFDKDNFKMFKLLLKYGANINLKDKNGDTILDKFYKEEYDPQYINIKKYIAFLKKHGAKTAVELKAEKKTKD